MVAGRTMVVGVVAEFVSRLAGDVVFLPNEKPIAKKNAQTNTRVKKMASMRPVPNVISVSCCAVGIRSSDDL